MADDPAAKPGTYSVAAPEPDAPIAAYVAAFVVYVALGVIVKSVVLNWIVGPTFLLLTLYALPRGLRRLGQRRPASRR